MPDTPAGFEQMKADWMAYFGKLGASLVDPGAPFGERTLVGGAKATTVSGYSIVKAKDLAQAKEMTAGHPHVAGKGGIEIVTCESM